MHTNLDLIRPRHGVRSSLVAFGFAALGLIAGYTWADTSSSERVTCNTTTVDRDDAAAALAGQRPIDAGWWLTDAEYIELRVSQYEHAAASGCAGASSEVAASLRGAAVTR